jgi:KDO2-lipid IV(A) lauroyltransferase
MPARLRHVAEYGLYRLVEGILRYLPWGTAQAMGEVAGSAAYWLNGRHRRVALENILNSDLGLSKREAINTAKECFRHFGALSFTLPQLLFMDAEELSRRVHFEGLEHWDAARRLGKGFIGLTGHFGNWEAMALALSASGRPLAVIGRKLRNPRLDSRMRTLRTRFGNRAIDKGGALKETVKLLKQGMGVGFLLDQDAGSRGIFTKFLGRQASTYPTAAALALRFGLPVIPIFSYPTPDGSIAVRAEPALEIVKTGDAEKDIQAATQLMCATLESQVRRIPHAWFWMHRRFKTQPHDNNYGPMPQ